MIELVQRLVSERRLSAEEFRKLISLCDSQTLDYLRKESVRTAQKRFGLGIFIRGLIEISSFCRNDCFYCGLRRSNRLAERYRLSQEQILECCGHGYRAGLRTFVLQGGEDLRLTDEWLVEVMSAIRNLYPDVAVTLYEVINETHAGTYDDPIPYDGNMALTAGLCYMQDYTIYKCTRDTGAAVYHALSELVGLYVEIV